MWKDGGSHVRTLYREGAPVHLFCTLRSQHVRQSLHRNGTPAAGHFAGGYEALRAQAKSNRRSIAAETISLLENTLPTRSELRRRGAFYRQVQRLRSRQVKGPEGPSAEDLLREDRNR